MKMAIEHQKQREVEFSDYTAKKTIEFEKRATELALKEQSLISREQKVTIANEAIHNEKVKIADQWQQLKDTKQELDKRLSL